MFAITIAKMSSQPVSGAGPEEPRASAFAPALFGLAMLGLAFAAVPLYRIFCQVTGFGGTTMKAEAAPGAVAGQIGVRFDANIDAGPAVEVRAGAGDGPHPSGRAHHHLLPRDQLRPRGATTGTRDLQRHAGPGRANISARSNASASPSRR